MRSLRRTIQIKDGVKVQMLFTPHLFSFKGYKGLTFEVASDAAATEVFEMYADIMYAAALNAWVLDEGGEPDDFVFTRGDFHEYMASDPKTFAGDVSFAVEALTGKSMKDLSQKNEQPQPEAAACKKKVSPLTGRLLRRSS